MLGMAHLLNNCSGIERNRDFLENSVAEPLKING